MRNKVGHRSLCERKIFKKIRTGEMCIRQLLSKYVTSEQCDTSIRESNYLAAQGECEWLHRPRWCCKIRRCLVAFGLYLGIVSIALHVYIDSNKFNLHNRFPTKLTVLEPIVKCEFDKEDLPFLTSGAESSRRCWLSNSSKCLSLLIEFSSSKTLNAASTQVIDVIANAVHCHQ